MNLEYPEMFYQEIALLGRLFGNEERADSIINWYQGRMTAIDTAVGNIEESEKPSVLVLYYSAKDGVTSFGVPPLSWIQTDMVKYGGGIPV